jgi:hypothetical protein
MVKVIQFPKKEKLKNKYKRVNGQPKVGELYEKIKKDMRMGVTFWNYETKQQLITPKEVLLHFVMQIDLQIQAPIDENGESVVLCDARKKGEECPLCEEIDGKIKDD